MQTFIKRLYADQRGATAIEYALILSLMFLVILASLTVFSDNIKAMFQAVSAAITKAG
ncbi:MAG: Flp family type IVb pilin [Robiginitomaculum sp.]|nr:Flp family type IVb pilin [Robiginitomaculum sp.]MDQ7076778.1 Flp family type IVb pilin [Robiginitomaculum sp.]